MEESNKIHLQPREIEALNLFLEKAEKDEEGDLCAPLFDSNTGKVYIYREHRKAYQEYALRRVMKLVNIGIFFIKVKKVKRNKKFLCMKSENLDRIKEILES